MDRRQRARCCCAALFAVRAERAVPGSNQREAGAEDAPAVLFRFRRIAFRPDARAALVGEHLTHAHLDDAREQVRTNKFFEDPSLPPGEGATLADYKRSGFDRGHMSPAGDRWNDEAMAQSFTLANIVPQDRENNQHLWAHIESAVRKLAIRHGDAYVVTGPLFAGQTLRTIGATRVFVPTRLFKVVYVPAANEAFAIVVDNVSTNRYDIKTVHELEAMSGMRFGGIPEALKDQRIGGLKGV